jgi:hypothetical protein
MDTTYKYKEGDLITLEKTGIICTLTLPWQGPYKVIKHHINGSITIEKEPRVTCTFHKRWVKQVLLILLLILYR